MTVSYWNDRVHEQKNSKKQEKDIVIIGGGIAGFSLAYWLSREDASLKIAIVDKMHFGEGATGRNAGFITCGSVEHFNRLVGKHGKDEANEIWKFSEDNLKLLKENIIQENAAELLFEHKGSFSLASTANEFAELKNSADIMRSLNINVDILGEQDIKARLGAEKFVGGIKYKDDASIHPIMLLRQLKKAIAAINANVEFFEHNEVYAMEQAGDNKVVKTNKHHFEAPMIILATNGYSPLLHPFFEGKIFPTRGQILATEAVPRFMEGPCYANFVLDYFRQLPTGEMIIGGFRQLQRDAEIGYSDQTSDVIQTALESFLHEHIPAVRKARITHRWSGIMGFSVDGQPMVGALPTDPQIFFTGAFTAHGLGLAFNSAKHCVDAMFGRSIPRWLSAKRFA
jgi:glycine/D-amino acid oxidase-like deaminating enzyme